MSLGSAGTASNGRRAPRSSLFPHTTVGSAQRHIRLIKTQHRETSMARRLVERRCCANVFKKHGHDPRSRRPCPRPSRRPTRGPQSRAKPRVTPLVTISDWRYLLRRHHVTTPALWAGRLSLKGPCLRIDRKTAGLSRHRTTRRAPATPPWTGSYSCRQPLAHRGHDFLGGGGADCTMAWP